MSSIGLEEINNSSIPVWPDAWINSSQISTKVAQKVVKEVVYLKREVFKIAQKAAQDLG